MKPSGYTLIELMVVVAIVGIISAIAYPSYQGYLRDTYQAQAVADLQSCSSAIERYYSNDYTYAGADTAGVCTAWSPSDGPEANKRYTLSFPTLTATNYVIRMTPVDEGACVQLAANGTQSSC
ncbi:MAG: type IV pilin protein [Pseudomonadales bacterium]